jgi:hypothetical protein
MMELVSRIALSSGCIVVSFQEVLPYVERGLLIQRERAEVEELQNIATHPKFAKSTQGILVEAFIGIDEWLDTLQEREDLIYEKERVWADGIWDRFKDVAPVIFAEVDELATVTVVLK